MKNEKIVAAELNDFGARMLKTSLGAIRPFFDDPSVIEIYLNADKKLWIERLGSGREYTGITIEENDSTRIIEIIASYCHSTADSANPIISAELPNFGSRFEGKLPPVVESPEFNIRQKALKIFTLDDYIAQRALTSSQCETIKKAVLDRKNILIIGGTGSGKTTFANAVLDEISKTNDRVLILEDTRELQCTSSDVSYMRTQDNVSMTRLLASAMRCRPDRIVVGEVRNGAALDLLKAWNTGHPGGLSTVHANSIAEAPARLEMLMLEATTRPIPSLIAQAVDLMIFISKVDKVNAEGKLILDDSGKPITQRCVKEIAVLHGYKNNVYDIEYI